MTTSVDLCNRALIKIGSQRTISSLSQDSIEAKACNAIYANSRDDLLRMAPWNCAFNTTPLVYITSVPGTPENTSPATALWQKGQPAPPWAYEYQYPVDCLRACWITPQTATGFAGGVPITTAVTGGASSFWQGPPVRFKIAVDQFYTINIALVSSPGTGHRANDIITLANGATNQAPIGGAAQIRVLTVDGAGGILTFSIINQIPDTATAAGGSYYYLPTSLIAQGSTTGFGTGAVFNVALQATGDQRVILTNQEFALLNYVRQVTNVNIFDSLFSSALQDIIAAQLAMVLTGDKNLANQSLSRANSSILEARGSDGNEGLTINDVVPDWIRARGIDFLENYSGPYNNGFNWGGSWPGYS